MWSLSYQASLLAGSLGLEQVSQIALEICGLYWPLGLWFVASDRSAWRGSWTWFLTLFAQELGFCGPLDYVAILHVRDAFDLMHVFTPRWGILTELQNSPFPLWNPTGTTRLYRDG